MNLPTPAHESTEVAVPVGRWGAFGWIVIALVFAAGCWIRWKIATGELLWLDELHTGWAVGGSFEQALSRSAQGNQTPLFFGLVWTVVQWMGTSELSLRLVSLLAGTLAMVFAARFVWLQTKSIAAAGLTLTLIAIDDNFIRYATEARPYALLHLASVMQVGWFWSSLKRWRDLSVNDAIVSNRWFGTLGLLLFSWLVVYTHYTGVFLLVAELLFVVPLLLSRFLNGNAIKPIFVTVVLFAVGCLPLLLQMSQAFGKPADWSSVAKLVDFQAEQKVNGIRWFAIPVAAALLSTAIAFLFFRKPQTSDRKNNAWGNIGWLSWCVAWFVVPLLIIVSLHLWRDVPIALSRYLAVCLIAGPIFAGGVVGICNVRSRWIAIPLVLLASVFAHLYGQSNQNTQPRSLPLNYRVMGSVVPAGRLPLLRIENWQAPIEVVNSSSGKAKWPLFLFGAVIEDAHALSEVDPEFQAYLQFPVQSLYPVDGTDRVVFAGPTIQPQHFDDRYLADVVEQGGAWVLVRHLPEITQEISNELVNRIQTELGDADAAVKANWFGNRDNLVQLISIEISTSPNARASD